VVPGSTGPKDCETVAHEFNARFKDELKDTLAVSTVRKRGSTAKKAFERENPRYQATVAYPVPTAAEHGDQVVVDVEEEGIGQNENGRMYTNVPDREIMASPAPAQIQEKFAVLPRIDLTPQPTPSRPSPQVI
jgi:hypothetical protein